MFSTKGQDVQRVTGSVQCTTKHSICLTHVARVVSRELRSGYLQQTRAPQDYVVGFHKVQENVAARSEVVQKKKKKDVTSCALTMYKTV